MRLVPGAAVIELDKAIPGFRNEAGGHRIQRIPPTERRGRVHSSTVTVAVMETSRRSARPETIPGCDLRVRWFSGTGAGGQHRNKHQCSVELTHVPTGISRKAETRSRENSMRLAMEALLEAIAAGDAARDAARINSVRTDQIGVGMRADKRRTWRFRDDRVVDDVTGLSTSCSRALRGGIDALWPAEDRPKR